MTFPVSPEAERVIRDAAAVSISRLLQLLADDEIDRATGALRLSVAYMAMAAPAASIGVCAIDGTSLLFTGRKDGLYVCCGGSPQHCWRLP